MSALGDVSRSPMRGIVIDSVDSNRPTPSDRSRNGVLSKSLKLGDGLGNGLEKSSLGMNVVA